MDLDKYTNYLIVVLVLLLVVNYVGLMLSWEHFSITGIVISVVILCAINILAIYFMSKIKIYKDGKEKKLSDIFGDVLVVTVLLAILSVVLFVIGLVVGYHIGGKNGLLIPLIATGIFYSSLFLVVKIKN